MDANTQKRLLTGVLAALMVSSVFATVVFPTAEAGQFTPGATDALVDANTVVFVSFNGTPYYNVAEVVTPTSGQLLNGTQYDLVFTNITTASTNNGYGYAPGGHNAMRLIRPDFSCQTNPCQTRPATTDFAHTGMFNVTFPGFTFDAAGLWTLRDDSNVTVARLFVMPQTSGLSVALSTNTFAATTGTVAFTITVSPVAAGQQVIVNSSPILPPTVILGQPSGIATFTYVGPLPQAGTFGVYASIETYNATNEWNWCNPATPDCTGVTTGARNDTDNFGNTLAAVRSAPEVQTFSNLIVNPSQLIVTPLTTTILAGFSTIGAWNITDVHGNAPFLAPIANDYNLTVTDSSGNMVVANVTTPGGASRAQPELKFYDANTQTWGTGLAAGPTGNVTIFGRTIYFAFDPLTGNFGFRPNTTWGSTTYTFNLGIDTAGGISTSNPEEVATWTLTPSAPQTVNLQANAAVDTACRPPIGTVTSGTQITAFCVLPPTPDPGFPTAPGAWTVDLIVTGNVVDLHPLHTGSGNYPATFQDVGSWVACGPTAATCASITNVTLSGDILNGWQITGYDPTTGTVTVSNVIPTKVNGNVNFNVNWQNTTTTLTLPITQGAQAALSPNTIVVDLASTVTVTLTDSFGNTIPDGKVFLFNGSSSPVNLGAGNPVVNGTGAPGNGGNGQYTFNIQPSVVGNFYVVGQIGSNTGATDNRNFTYALLKVVPAHDVSTTISTNAAMASVTTYVFLNATQNGTGIASDSQIYFLNDSDFNNMVQNNSLPVLGAAGTFASTSATIATGAGWTSSGINLNVTLPPGNYHVYVRTFDQKHDNLNNAPTFTVNKFHAVFAPAQIANNPNVESNTTVNVTITDVHGTPWNGTLYLNTSAAAEPFGNLTCITSANNTCTGSSAVTTYHLTITNGMGTFVATGRDIGPVHWDFAPTGTGAAPTQSPVDTDFQVVGPMVTLNPTRVPQGSPAQISVSVQSLNGTALSGLWVQLCGGPISGGTFALNASPDGNFYSCTSGEPTDANGLATVSFTPLTNGVVWLYLNNDTTPSYVTVYSGLQIVWSPSSPVQNDTVTVTVSKIGSTVPPSGVTVYVEQNGSAVSGFPQTASSNGQVVIPNVQQGTYNVTAVAAGFQNATAQIVVGPAAVAPPPAQAKFQLSNLNVPSTGTVGQPLTASADISNTGNADGTANALLIVNGAVRDTRSIPIAAGGRETVAFDFTPTQAGSFQVTIKLATGETLAEQTVTISTPQSTTTTTTTTTTTPSITTTTTTTTSTTTVSSTPTTSSPHVPGFEVVALVGALAVALLVMRRRQK